MLVFLTLLLKLSKKINVLVDTLGTKLCIPTEVVESFARGGKAIYIDDNTVANLMFKYRRIVMCSLLSTKFRSSFKACTEIGVKILFEKDAGGGVSKD